MQNNQGDRGNPAKKSFVENSEKFRLIFEHSPLGFFHVDNAGLLTDCNENFVKIIDITVPEQLNGRTVPVSDQIGYLC